MKKLSKILILVLSLSLVCGLLAVFAFAEEPNTAARKEATQNFDSITDVETWVVNKETGNGSITGSGTQLQFLLANRTGYVEAFSSTIDDGNNKAVVLRADGRASKDAYAYIAYDTKVGYNGDEAKITATSPENYANNSYYVWDVDIMAPTGKVLQDVYFQWNGQYQTADKSNTFISYKPNRWFFGYNDTIGTYAYNSADTKTLYPISNDVTNWQHVTMILDIDVKADTTLYATNYLYVDGKYIASYGANFGGATSTYYNGVVAGSMNEIKIGFGNGSASTYTDLNGSLAIDNYRVRAYSTSYNGNLSGVLSDKTKSLTEWESNVYNESAMPAGLALIEINETKYDSFSAATTAMEAMDYVEATMLSDVVNFTIPKSGKVYYTTAAQYDAIKTADGYGKAQKEDAVGTFAEIAPAVPKEVYYDYHWGDGCTDTHFLSAKASVPVGEKILSQLPTDTYTLENGLIQGYFLQGGKYVRHTGWKYLDVEIDYDDDFQEIVVGVTEGEDVALDALVTAETADVVYLKPVFTEVDASVLADALYAVVASNGTANFYNKDTTLKAAIEAAPAGSTLVLLGDVAHDPNVTETKITISKKLTIDLNGHTLDVRSVHYIARPAGATNDNANKLYVFNSITDLTVTSSALGGKIFHASASNATNSGRRVTGGFISMAKGGKFAMTAQGPEYLTIYTGTVVNNYSTHVASVTYQGIAVIDNGATDNNGLLFYSACDKFTMKDCVVISAASTKVVRLDGRDGNAQTTTQQTAIIDNCIIIAPSLTEYTCKTVDFTITNSFISGDIAPSKAYPNEDQYKGYITLGAGNYIGGNLNDRVKFADGVQKYDVTSYFQSTFKVNKYSAIPTDKIGTTNAIDSDLVVFDQVYSTTYKYYTGATGLADVTVNLGTTGKTATIKSGMIPSGSVAGLVAVENWVNINSIWYADYTDDAATAEVTLTESVDELVQGFNNSVYYQFRYSDHISAFTFIPVAPEGIEYTYAYYGTKRESNRLTATVNTIDDVQYIALKGNWNGVLDFVNGLTLNIEYTYAGKTFTYTVKASIVDYAKAVLANVGEKYSVEDQNYVIGLASYANAVLTYRGKANADITKIATDYADSITLPEGFGETAYTATDLSAYVESISLAIYDARARLKVTMKDAAYTLSIKDANGNAIPMKQTSGTAVWESGDYLFYQLVDDLTITVSDGTNTVVAEGYTLSNYAAAVKAVDANAYAIVCAMYEYGVAQKQLRVAHAN